jgi:DNA topoisomerase-1
VGEADSRRFGNVPEDLPPADLSVEKALELLSQKEPEQQFVGTHPVTGRRLILKNRQGFYLEAERTPEELEAKAKPTWISVPPGVDPRQLSQDEIAQLCAFPRLVGKGPDKQEIWFKIGKYGAYLESGTERRTVENWKLGSTMNVEEALVVLAQPKFASARKASMEPIKSFTHNGSTVRVLSGRFGPYVTDGEVNATLPRGVDPVGISEETALELLEKKRAAGPSTRKPFRRAKGKSFAGKAKKR